MTNVIHQAVQEAVAIAQAAIRDEFPPASVPAPFADWLDDLFGIGPTGGDKSRGWGRIVLNPAQPVAPQHS